MKHGSTLALAAGLSVLSGCSGVDEFADGELEPTATTAEPLVAVSGTRKLMFIAMKDCATCELAQTHSWYLAKIFGPATPNVKDYYDVVSRGRFHFSATSESGFITNPNTAAFDARAGVTSSQTPHEQAVRRAVLGMGDALAKVGASFNRYDTNGDRDITTDELTIAVISNAVQGGKTIRPCVTMADGIRVCSHAAYSGDREQIQNLVHELGHTFGSLDLYGAWNSHACHSDRGTIMSCTGQSTEMWFNFDPWHRRKLGWYDSSQIIIAGQGSTGTFTVVSPRMADISHGIGQEVVRFRNPAGQLEELNFERRTRSDNYDQNTVHSGVIAWWTLEHSNGQQLAQIPSLVAGASGDDAHFRLAPVNCVGDPLNPLSRGEANPLKEGSSYRFKWRDGTDTGYLFTVGGTDASGRTPITYTLSSAAPSCTNP